MQINSVTFREYVSIGPGRHTQKVARPDRLEPHEWGVLINGLVLVPWAMVLSMEVQAPAADGEDSKLVVPLHPAIVARPESPVQPEAPRKRSKPQ